SRTSKDTESVLTPKGRNHFANSVSSVHARQTRSRVALNVRTIVNCAVDCVVLTALTPLTRFVLVRLSWFPGALRVRRGASSTGDAALQPRQWPPPVVQVAVPRCATDHGPCE